MHTDRVSEVWDALQGHHLEVIQSFYQRFFERFPDYRRFFPETMDQQMKKMVRTIGLVCRVADSTSVVEPHVEQVGSHHRAYDLERSDLENFRSVFIEVLGEYYGDQWGADHEQAWNEAFDELLIPAMLKGLAQAH